MMNTLYSLLGTLISLGVLISFHEFGHFWIARRCGVKVLRFSIGFGRPLLRWYDKQGTEFVIAAIPLGGYVRMLDSRELSANNKARDTFDLQPVKKRMAIVAAGPLANIILAFLLFWFVALLGKEQPRPVIGGLEPGSIAEQIGLPIGSEITAIDDEPTTTWQSVALKLFSYVGETNVIRVHVTAPGNSAAQIFSLPVTASLWHSKTADPVIALGIKAWQPPIYPQLNQIEVGSPADKAGFRVGDILRRFNGEPINDWREFVERVRALPAAEVQIEFERSAHVASVLVSLAARPSGANAQANTAGYFGAGVKAVDWPTEMLRDNSFDPLHAIPEALKQTVSVTEMTFSSIGKMLQGSLSVKNLSGPITIAKVAGDSARAGLVDFLGFMALLSVSLAVLNVLPIPTLDGGHLLFQVIELVTGRPVSENVQAVCMKIGAFLIFSLMFLAIFNDISRL